MAVSNMYKALFAALDSYFHLRAADVKIYPIGGTYYDPKCVKAVPATTTHTASTSIIKTVRVPTFDRTPKIPYITLEQEA